MLFAVLSYAPFLLNQPGKISADTKAYLYLNPGRLLQTATSMWNPDQGFGMVTHQNIGYLFPMGPYFWLTHEIGIPTWIAQRFWMGSLLFFAGLGVRKLAQELGLSRTAAWSAALPYTLTPFILVNIGRTSAILMPWAGLGWLMLFAVRAVRHGGWRNAARFAFVVALVGGVNATSVLLVGLAPALWIVYSIATKEAPWRAAIGATGKMVLLSGAVSLWWMAGLWAESRYGINILRYTETIPTVSATSTSTESFRGLGYWYFYGSDQIQLWTQSSSAYTVGNLAPLPSLLLPTLAVVAGIFVQWRYRVFAALLAFGGIVIAVGAYPYNQPTPVGSILKWFGENTTAGLAMRSTNRVAPVFILAFALLIGSGVDAVRHVRRRSFMHSALAVAMLSILAMSPLFLGKALAPNLTSPETVPTYVTEAAQLLNSRGSESNGVLGLPGLDFGYYQWGAYVDSAWPGLLNRPFVTSQVTLQGEPASVNLVRGLDGPIQDLVANPRSIVPIARILGTGDVLVQFDTQYDRFAGPPPWYLWNLVGTASSGLTPLQTFGPTVADETVSGRYVNESNLELGNPSSWPPSLAVYSIQGVRALVRTEPVKGAVIVAGDGEGLVNIAGLGGFPDSRAIFYDGSLSPQLLNQLTTSPSARLYVTDSNQRRLNTFGVLHSSPGYVMRQDERPLEPNPAQQSLYAFINKVPGSQTVAVLNGIRAVGASSYGNPIGNNPEQQPYLSMDSDISTSWKTAAFADARESYLQIELNKPTKLKSLHLVQPQDPTTNRWITDLGISVDGHHVTNIALPEATREASGGDVTFPATVGQTIRLTVRATTGDSGNMRTMSGVGFAEISSPSWPHVDHSLLMPTSLLRRAGNASTTSQVTFVMTRLRAASTPPRTDPENYLDRMFELPNSRTFRLSGNATVNATISDAQLNELLDRKSGTITGTDSSHRLLGSLRTSSYEAFDGNPLTAWMPTFMYRDGQWIRFTTSNNQKIGKFSIGVVNDGIHSVPTRMTLRSGQERFTFKTGLRPALGETRGHVDYVRVSAPQLSGRDFTLTVDATERVQVRDRVTGGINIPPFAIAEIAIPGLSEGRTPERFNTGCRSDLLNIDGVAVPVRISGPTADAVTQQRLSVTQCGPALTLTAGMHRLVTSDGRSTGLNIEQIAVNSPGTSGAVAPTLTNHGGIWKGRSTVTASLTPEDSGRWVVLGQSFSGGWRATLNGVDLGGPSLIDGASMGWRLPNKVPAGSTVVFDWMPQRRIWLALWLSLAGLIAVCTLAVGRAPRSTWLPPDAHPWPRTQFTQSSRSVMLAAGVAMATSLAVHLLLIPLLVLGAIWVTARSSRQKPWIVVTIASFGLAAMSTLWTVHQFLVRDISWPSKVPFANSLTWIGLAMWLVFVVATSDRAAPVIRDSEGDATVPAARRRGLNIPDSHETGSSDEKELLDVVVAPRGLLRTFALVRAQINRRRNGSLYEKIRAADAINQVVGQTPLYNRDVLEMSPVPTPFAGALTARGARVVTMRRSSPLRRRSQTSHVEFEGPTFTNQAIEATDESFDLIYATNVLSTVNGVDALLDEMIRVARVGGTIVIHNVTWWSPWGGFETSPWHLVSGNLARARYQRKNGVPTHSYGVTLSRLKIRDVLSYFSSDPRVVVVQAGPYWLPESFGWIVKIPVLRELVTMNLSIRIERVSR